MEGWMVLLLIAANFPIYIGLGWLFYGSWEDFKEAMSSVFPPGIVSLFYGEFLDDLRATIKLWIFTILCFAVVGIQIALIMHFYVP